MAAGRRGPVDAGARGAGVLAVGGREVANASKTFWPPDAWKIAADMAWLRVWLMASARLVTSVVRSAEETVSFPWILFRSLSAPVVFPTHLASDLNESAPVYPAICARA